MPPAPPVHAEPASPAGSAAAADSLDVTGAEALARVLKALAEPTRLRLLSLVASHDGGEACVCDLTDPVGLSQPTVSHHLRVLVDAGLLTRDKRGIWSYYALVPHALDAVADLVRTAADGGRGPRSGQPGRPVGEHG